MLRRSIYMIIKRVCHKNARTYKKDIRLIVKPNKRMYEGYCCTNPCTNPDPYCPLHRTRRDCPTYYM